MYPQCRNRGDLSSSDEAASSFGGWPLPTSTSTSIMTLTSRFGIFLECWGGGGGLESPAEDGGGDEDVREDLTGGGGGGLLRRGRRWRRDSRGRPRAPAVPRMPGAAWQSRMPPRRRR